MEESEREGENKGKEEREKERDSHQILALHIHTHTHTHTISTLQLKHTQDQVNDLRAQLEEANVRTAISDSKLGEIESKHAQELGQYESIVSPCL